MRFPEKTPAVVRAAITGYARHRTFLAAGTAISLGLGLSGLAALATMVADRLIEYAAAWRETGPWLCGFIALGTLAALLRALLRREHPLAIAIRLDQAFRQNEDRWATALDLAARQARGEHVGLEESVRRLYKETEEKTTAAQARRLIPAWPLAAALAVAACVALGFASLHLSGFFNLELLWQRFWNPHANLPRDSIIQIRIVGMQPPESPITSRPIPLAKIPENETFTLRVELLRQGHALPADAPSEAAGQSPIPRLEIVSEGRTEGQIEFVRTGKFWTLTRPNVTETMVFRIRAGDALTANYAMELQPRIKIAALKHSIRYPAYARLPDVQQKPLEINRLSLLEDSWLDLVVECDSPIKEFEAVFELLENRAEALAGSGPALTLHEQWLQENLGQGKASEEQGERRRNLRVKVRKDATATFRLKIDQSGILRVRPTGENDLPGLERALVIEAVQDAPPRVSISGIDADTSIVPGELVAYQFTLEDDLAVADLVMEWDVAGGARSGDLYGEEYIKSDQFGQRVVSGQDVIQRMNYYVYGTTPFVFTLVVIDSKGQESRSPSYRIHLLSDTFAARFESGLEFLKQLEWAVGFYRGHFQELYNHLNIIAAAAGASKTWPQGQDKLLENYLKSASNLNPGFNRERARHYYSGWPQRFLESTGFLLAAQRCLDTDAFYLQAGRQLRATEDLPATIRALQERLKSQLALVELWGAAVASERYRFAPEAALQKIRNLRQRLAKLPAIKSNKTLYEANLRFYRDELGKILAAVQALEKLLVEASAPILARLQAGLKEGNPASLMADLRDLERTLASQAPPLSPALAAVLDELGRQARNDAQTAQRLMTAVAETISNRESEGDTAPLADLSLCRLWINHSLPENHPWYLPPTELLDVWLLADRLEREWKAYRLHVEMKRYALHPDQGDDVEAELREQALVLLDRVARAGDLDAELSAQLLQILLRVARGELRDPPGANNLAQLRAAMQQLEPAGRARLQTLSPQFPPILEELRKGLEAAADRYDSFAAEMEAEFQAVSADPEKVSQAYYYWSPARNRAEELQAGPKALEIAYRKLHFLRTLLELDPPASRLSWEAWQPWHGLHLILLINSEHAFDKVTYRFGATDWKNYGLVPQHARAYARQLRQHAAVTARAAASQPLEFDFHQLMQDTKTVGYFDTLQREFDWVSPFLGPSDAEPRQHALEQLQQSQTGRIIRHEHLLAALLARRDRLQGRQSITPSLLLAELQGLEQTLAEAREGQDIEAIEELVAELSALPPDARDQPISASMKRRLEAFLVILDEEMKAQFAAVQIPPPSMTQRANLRDYSAVARTFWPIAGVINNYDRRWMHRMDESQFALARDLYAVGQARPGDADQARAFAITYARMIELRARQLAHERRKNRGISYLEEGGGPTLKLPPHIAQEFLRARNRRPPLLFKERAEAYFRQLFRDLSR